MTTVDYSKIPAETSGNFGWSFSDRDLTFFTTEDGVFEYDIQIPNAPISPGYVNLMLSYPYPMSLIIDDGYGNFTDNNVNGTVDYNTGACKLTFTADSFQPNSGVSIVTTSVKPVVVNTTVTTDTTTTDTTH